MSGVYVPQDLSWPGPGIRVRRGSRWLVMRVRAAGVQTTKCGSGAVDDVFGQAFFTRIEADCATCIEASAATGARAAGMWLRSFLGLVRSPLWNLQVYNDVGTAQTEVDSVGIDPRACETDLALCNRHGEFPTHTNFPNLVGGVQHN